MKKLVVYFISFFPNSKRILSYSSNPKDFVYELVSEAIMTLSDKNLNNEQKKTFIEKVALENVDIHALGLYTLGELKNPL